VPAGVFGNCRSIVSTEVAKVPGQGTITASGLTAYLAPGVGIIKTLVTVGHWAELVSGTVGGLAITPPGILVEDRTGNAFLSGSSTLNFSTVPVSAAGNYPITVLNSGTAALTILAASITGDNASMFHAGPLGATTLSSGSSTTFNTSFAPTAAGPASAVLHVTSSDPKTPSYDIALAGAGIVSLASQAGVFTGLLDGDKGFITLTLSATGKFTGHLLLGGTAYTISGTAMDGYGDFTGTTGKTPKPPLTIAFHLALPAAAGSVGDYFLTGSAGNATFECTHSAYAKGLTLSGTGKYTVLLEFAEEGYPFPEGVGYAAMTVGSTGGIALAGKLADGLPFSASAIMLGGSAKGSLAGTLVFGPDAGASALSGTLDWVKPAQSKGDYPAAFDATLIAAGSPYKPPGRGDSALPGFTAGTLALSDTAGFVLSPAVSLTASDKLEITGADKDSLKVALTPATGLFTGAFIYPGQKAPTVFGGVLLQDQVRGAGLFLGPDGSGAVSLTPGP
jgi:hypothetical protein